VGRLAAQLGAVAVGEAAAMQEDNRRERTRAVRKIEISFQRYALRLCPDDAVDRPKA
jgi:hypothetical protein